MNRIKRILDSLYGRRTAAEILPAVHALIGEFRKRLRGLPGGGFDERDAMLITYPDMVRESGSPPLQTLMRFCDEYLGDAVTCIHLLPFFPSSSDDGFSVVDYLRVDSGLGDWRDIERMAGAYRLMFDAVFNHMSVQSEWFRGFLDDDPLYRRFFITVPEGTNLSGVVRPRSHPLLTQFRTASGGSLVWTTFSADQADLNYAEPAVLLSMLEVLLSYAEHGASLVRLDAIGYIWKKTGTRCIHLPRAHRIVQLFRAVLDRTAPRVLLVTETNVAHRENLSYFGDGANEAQAVYNFALPPLTLHAFYTGEARVLSRWAAGLSTPSRKTTFLNFLASHDGIGVNPARGILTGREIDALVDGAVRRGALVSFRSGTGGETVPYELNINYWDALCAPGEMEALETLVDRFMAAHALMFALPGIPGIYFHSLFGSTGWREGVMLSGGNRAVNRKKYGRAELAGELEDPDGRRARVFGRMKKMLLLRSAFPCFHPQGGCRILSLDPAVFAIVREAPGGGERVLCLQNVSGHSATVPLEPRRLFGFQPKGLRDILTDCIHPASGNQGFDLRPYQVAWLQGER